MAQARRWSPLKGLTATGMEETDKGEGIRQRCDLSGLGEKFEKLAGLMVRLRSPGGCPWDLEQTPETLTGHLLEEAYESVEAIEASDWEHLEEELGDLLLQIVFQSRIAQEEGRFDLGTVVEGISEKLVRRHPHIFGSDEADTADEVAVNWERIKKEQEGKEDSMSLPRDLPALMAAFKIQKRAARDGFDWSEGREVLEKLDEESEELREALDGSEEALEKEVGDILFTVVNVARHFSVDPESALRSSNREFIRRYSVMEERARESGTILSGMTLDEKEELWQRAKEENEPEGDRR
jgi:MazG family protein